MGVKTKPRKRRDAIIDGLFALSEGQGTIIDAIAKFAPIIELEKRLAASHARERASYAREKARDELIKRLREELARRPGRYGCDHDWVLWREERTGSSRHECRKCGAIA